MLHARATAVLFWAAGLVVCGCSSVDDHSPGAASVDHAGQLHAEFGRVGDIEVHGYAHPGMADTDQRPEFQLFLGDDPLEVTALDAAVESMTRSLVWLAPSGTLWMAPLDDPQGVHRRKRALAERVIPGLATSRGRVAFARRVSGPETAPFVVDLRTFAETALADGAGPDEVMGFSPDGDEVLILSGRTGLASLFALAARGTRMRQLTNHGLAPGPGLDTRMVAPSPIDARQVAWGRRGIAYRAHDTVIVVGPDGVLERLAPSMSVAEAVR